VVFDSADSGRLVPIMNRRPLIVLRRVALVLSVGAGLWSAWLALGGVVFITLGPIHATSRNPRNPLLMAAIGAVAFGLLTWRLGDRAGLDTKWLWLRQRLGAVSWSIGLLPVVVALAGATVDMYQWSRGAPVWLDEEMIAINFRDRSFMNLAGPLWLGQSAPYGWLVAERAVILGFGTGELPLRAVPLIFGIATLAAAVWIGRRWLTGFGATMLVLLFWISSSFAHYRFEVKHYTADIFFALLLPVLAVWATEAPERTDRRRRARIWWGIAAAAHWFANGALLVTPACAICLQVLIWRRDGRQDAIRFATVGLVWLASFGLHYHVAMRYTHRSAYLLTYWQNELPPASAGPLETARWLADRVRPLAENPGGTRLFVSLWGLAIAGFAFGHRRLGVVLAPIPASAFVFAAAGVVPLFQRFSLWIVPALYLGVTLVVDCAVRWILDATVRKRYVQLALGASVAVAGIRLTSDIVEQGRIDHRINHPVPNWHALNDRDAVRWLMRYRQPGDAFAATRLAWPALWWYGNLPLPAAASAIQPPREAPAMYEFVHLSHSDCDQSSLRAAFHGQRRVLAYSGFPDLPEGFDDLLLRTLDDLGAVVASSEFSDLSRAVVIDLQPNAPDATVIPRRQKRPDEARPLAGCVGARPMRRW
jgi:hypothetical protein